MTRAIPQAWSSRSEVLTFDREVSARQDRLVAVREVIADLEHLRQLHTEGKLRAVIDRDPALSARILKVSNSSNPRRGLAPRSSSSRSYSFAVSSMLRSPRLAIRVVGSSIRSAKVSGASDSMGARRRPNARTRASNSSKANGFTR